MHIRVRSAKRSPWQATETCPGVHEVPKGPKQRLFDASIRILDRDSRHNLRLRPVREHTPGQKGAVTRAALGIGIGMVAGGSFGQVVGAGLVGGTVIGNKN